MQNIYNSRHGSKIGQAFPEFFFFFQGCPFLFTMIGAHVGLDIQGSHVDPGVQPGLKKREKTLIEQFITKLENGQRKSERQKSTPF